MKKNLLLLTAALFIGVGTTLFAISNSEPVATPSSGAQICPACAFNGKHLYGKVQVVTSFPDIKVQIVESFPDLKVKMVNSFPDACGKWQLVESFPDFKVQFVTSFPDIKIKYVDAFPGCN